MTDPMTTPPLDLPALKEIANAATQSEWTSYGYRVETVPALDLHRFDVMGEMVAECDLIEEDARHIAAFDPPTVLAILDRVEAAEGGQSTLRAQVADSDRLQFLARTRAEDAEAKARAVRALHGPATVLEAWETQGRYPEEARACLHCTSPDDSSPTLYPCPTIEALDGS